MKTGSGRLRGNRDAVGGRPHIWSTKPGFVVDIFYSKKEVRETINKLCASGKLTLVSHDAGFGRFRVIGVPASCAVIEGIDCIGVMKGRSND